MSKTPVSLRNIIAPAMAGWNALSDSTRGALVTAAAAYAVGRRTYVTDTVASLARREWPTMSEADRSFISGWIRSKTDLGDRCDERGWREVLALADGTAVDTPIAPISGADLHIAVFCAARAFRDAGYAILPAKGALEGQGPTLERICAAFSEVAAASLLSDNQRDGIVREMLDNAMTDIADALLGMKIDPTP